MPHFADRVLTAVKKAGNAVCVGLDPRFDQLPAFIRERALKAHGSTPKAAAEAYLAFNIGILDALAGIVPACKPQSAFYEEYGHEGVRVFEDTVRYAKSKGFIVIADAKRGDIGTTASAYAHAFLGGAAVGATLGARDSAFTSAQEHEIGSDAVTVNAYMGADTLLPFLDLATVSGKGIFALVKTSNPGSKDIQDLLVDGRPLYEHVAQMLNKLGEARLGKCGFTNAGAVVGATHPEQLKRLRELMPKTIFLIPGYGAQGGTAEDAALGFVDGEDGGRGALVNNSRGIIFAYKHEPYAQKYGEKGFAEAAREAAQAMAAALGEALAKK